MKTGKGGGGTRTTGKSLCKSFEKYAEINTLPTWIKFKAEGENFFSNISNIPRPCMRHLIMFMRLIFPDNKVCHLCAINLLDGNTAFHRTIEGGDNLQVAELLLAHEPGVAHTQNFQGYSPLHLACKLGRKKIVQKLLVSLKQLFELNTQLLQIFTGLQSVAFKFLLL